MKRYTYRNYGMGLRQTHPPVTFFVCDADSILAADEKLLAANRRCRCQRSAPSSRKRAIPMTTREGETMIDKAGIARDIAMQIVHGVPCESCRARKPDVKPRNFLGESVWICDWCMEAASVDELGEGLKCL